MRTTPRNASFQVHSCLCCCHQRAKNFSYTQHGCTIAPYPGHLKWKRNFKFEFFLIRCEGPASPAGSKAIVEGIIEEEEEEEDENEDGESVNKRKKDDDTEVRHPRQEPARFRT